MLAAVAVIAFAQIPTLTAEEKRAGWKLLFDGKTSAGWKNFKSDKLSAGWQIKDGVLTIADASTAGDIVSDEKFEWFELKLEFNLGKGQNSGVMYHVADDGDAVWHSGPEIQLYDHPKQEGIQTSGMLYELYSSPVDTAKPSGQWNELRILVSPKVCSTWVNGAKYYDYVLGSEDFKARVAKSKFAQYPNFGKLGKGRIAIQGDHGNVSFRNIKIRPIKG